MAEILVLASHASRTFGAGTRAVEALVDASCEARPGDRIAIVGPSGSGKSTLLHLIAGVDGPTSGRVEWPALGDRETLRPEHIGVVYQTPSLLPALTTMENVALPLLLMGREAEAGRAAETMLAMLGLADLAQKLPEELSGGQAQRVAMARAMCVRPRLIIADEPTGQLDHATAQALFDRLLTSIGPEAALIIATHDEAIARRVSTLWHMKDGRLDTPHVEIAEP